MKSVFKQLTITMLLVLPLSIPAFAYDKKDEQIIKKDLATMTKQMNKGNYKVIPQAQPKSFTNAFIKAVNTTPEAYQERIEMVADMMAHFGAKLQFDTNNIKGYQSDTGRDYALIPTTIIAADSQTKSHFLAIKENGKWHYIQYQDPRAIDLIEKTYPDIKKLP